MRDRVARFFGCLVAVAVWFTAAFMGLMWVQRWDLMWVRR